jgi:hypothetical protein
VRPQPLSSEAPDLVMIYEPGSTLAMKLERARTQVELLKMQNSLRIELIRARKLRERLTGQNKIPDLRTTDQSLNWLMQQLTETMDEARDAGDIAGALAAIRMLAVLLCTCGSRPAAKAERTSTSISPTW